MKEMNESVDFNEWVDLNKDRAWVKRRCNDYAMCRLVKIGFFNQAKEVKVREMEETQNIFNELTSDYNFSYDSDRELYFLSKFMKYSLRIIKGDIYRSFNEDLQFPMDEDLRGLEYIGLENKK